MGEKSNPPVYPVRGGDVAAATPPWPEVLKWVREAGFPLAGVVPLRPPAPATDRFGGWLASGRHGFLRYMAESASLREDPASWLPWARSVLCAALPYNTRRDSSARWTGMGHLWVSRYAWGRDYHRVVRSRLAPVVRRLEAACVRVRTCVDSAPLLERAYALEAGLGFQGKNGILVHPEFGSYLFLAEVVTDLESPEEKSGPLPGGCGSCNLCVEACPAGALRGPGDVDAGRCISAWTVEGKGGFGTAPPLDGHLFGCDRCQEVCPYNREAPLSGDSQFEPRDPWFAPQPEELLNLGDDDWERLTRGSVLTRSGRSELVRIARGRLEKEELAVQGEKDPGGGEGEGK